VAVVDSFRSHLQPYLAVAEGILAYTPKYLQEQQSIDFVLDSIWTPVVKLIAERFPLMFSVGIPNILSSCYRAFERFKQKLATIAGDAWTQQISRRMSGSCALVRLEVEARHISATAPQRDMHAY
jgi:hypothetical protein